MNKSVYLQAISVSKLLILEPKISPWLIAKRSLDWFPLSNMELRMRSFCETFSWLIPPLKYGASHNYAKLLRNVLLIDFPLKYGVSQKLRMRSFCEAFLWFYVQFPPSYMDVGTHFWIPPWYMELRMRSFSENLKSPYNHFEKGLYEQIRTLAEIFPQNSQVICSFLKDTEA